VTSKEDLDKLQKEFLEREKSLDLFIANAGISGPKAPPESRDASKIQDTLWNKESFEDWSAVLNTNVSGVYFSTVAFLPLLQKALHAHDRPHLSPSCIIISSMSGIMRDAQGHFSYNAAKGATVHLSRLMSSEFEKTGIRVNSIAPGYFPSEMTTGESDEANKSGMPREKVKNKGHEVPMGRAGADEEMAQTVLFLARNRYVNGEVIAVDGGVLNNVPGR
jgi:NAD(P)-dependent dehydrogenase (short-subunit alcohol dehydrogenase family)